MLSDEAIMAQVFQAFREEQAEHRQTIGEILLTLEREPDHPERRDLLDELFRAAHSMKGGARAAGQPAIEAISHRLEDLFSAVRRGDLALTPEVCDPAHAAIETIGTLIAQAAAGHPAAVEPHQELLDALGRAAGDGPSRPAPHAPGPAAPRPAGGDERAASDGAPAWEGGESTVRLTTAALDGLLNETGELVTCAVRARERVREVRTLADLPARWRRVWRRAQPALDRLRARAPALAPTVHYLDGGAGEAPRRHPGAHLSEQDIATLVDALGAAGALIAELEQGLAAHAHQAGEDHARLAAVTDRLRDQIRRTRMLPLSTIFGPLRLQVREMARTAGKQVALALDDGDTQADRQVLDSLRDVLTHLIRNAVDHGIEPPAARQAAGKPVMGHIGVTAAVSGDRLSLTIEDDGAGLDLDAIRRRALAAGLIGEADLARMGEADLADLIFLPGLSTRPSVSVLSGRGVGLDIVRARVERMRGRVAVQSTPGGGTRFAISVPLTLTSSHGLLLTAAGQRYMMPLEAIQRIVPVSLRSVQTIEGRAALTLAGRPVALVRLADLLGAAPAAKLRPGEAADQRMALLLGSGDRTIACMVDSVVSEQELVVYRLPAPLQRVRFIAGATILADGSVIPLLDVVDVLRAALSARQVIEEAAAPEAPQRKPTVLVADDSITTRTLEKNILEAAGYRVQLATDGAEALDLLRRLADDGGCDLLLSDVDMPRLSGFELTAQVRADHRLSHTPIVLVTSLDTPADRERGIAAGADAYIVKRAFDQQTLLETIAQLI